MTRAEQARTAATDIDWCCQAPHTVDQCIGHAVEHAGKLAEERRHDARSIGGHADPTAAGVHEQREPEEVSRTRSCALMLWDLARSVDTLARALNPHAPPMRDQPKVLAEMLRAATIPLHAHVMVLDDIEAHGDEDIDWLLHMLVENAAWLRRKCEGIWSDHKGALTAEPKPRLECVVCASHDVHDVDVDQGQRCARCARFIQSHDCWPSAAICREWDRHPVRPRVTPAMVADAKRQGVGRPKRKAKREVASA